MQAISKYFVLVRWCITIMLLHCPSIGNTPFGNIISIMNTYFVIILVKLSNKYEHEKKREFGVTVQIQTLSDWVTLVLL